MRECYLPSKYESLGTYCDGELLLLLWIELFRCLFCPELSSTSLSERAREDEREREREREEEEEEEVRVRERKMRRLRRRRRVKEETVCESARKMLGSRSKESDNNLPHFLRIRIIIGRERS